MSNQQIPTIPGTPFAGGFFIARFHLDGQEYALIDSGSAGELSGEWGEYGQDTAATHISDGLKNTSAMAEAGSELAKHARELNIGGFSDWYIPSQHEIALQFFSLRTAPAYQPAEANAFARDWYWSSTQFSPYNAWVQDFDDGSQHNDPKVYENRARAVRRELITSSI
ncbi:Lcl C-terminal domain-containing protein [Stutzerimonas nitrititolerans]|uniref:Lcl C-terminal domain-containing protein n=1 Tax=Stutzerimonas nitrititolerans TaxID=2482751 RepID=UPI00289A3324|nr:DUF1566 domain-containing protein [Stutzerimonas nitrititolerans]